MMETENFLKDLLNLLLCTLLCNISCTLQENSGIRYVIRDFVGIHKKGLQSVCKCTTVNVSTCVK